MRVLLDECVARRFENSLVSHQCSTVPDEGPAGISNGELLAAAERLGFELLITIDQGLAYQQNLAVRTIAILVLQPKASRLVDLLPLVPECLARVQSLRPGELVVITP